MNATAQIPVPDNYDFQSACAKLGKERVIAYLERAVTDRLSELESRVNLDPELPAGARLLELGEKPQCGDLSRSSGWEPCKFFGDYTIWKEQVGMFATFRPPDAT